MAYETGWRANKKSGEIAWSDGWVDGGHFQQIKGRGPVDPSLDAEFSKLTKSGSDVDDDGAWVTLHQQDTHGATQTAKDLAAKWTAAGYDVRVQDLEGHDGVVEADIAVRKGSGSAAPEAPKPEEAPEAPAAVEEKKEAGDINIDNSVSNENKVQTEFAADDFLGMYINNSFNATGGTLTNSGDLKAGGDISLDNKVTNSNTVNSYGSDTNNAQEFMNQYKLNLSK